MIRTKKFDQGEIDYKLPNVPQAMRLLARLGIGKEGLGARSEFEAMADLVEHIGPMVTAVRLTNAAGEAVTTFEALLEDLDFTRVLTDLATEIMSAFSSKLGDETRKNS